MEPIFFHPFALQIVGPSGAGKSYFVSKFLQNIKEICNVEFDRILFYYSEWQDLYENEFKVAGKKIEFYQGLPNPAHYSNDKDKKKLMGLDDLYKEADTEVLNLFTKGSHHKNISIMFLSQNIFYKGSISRDISLNTNYIVIFKNPRDSAQFRYLARQVYPADPKFLLESYTDATARPHGYLLLDLKQATPDEYRFRTNIFPTETPHFVYLPKYKNH